MSTAKRESEERQEHYQCTQCEAVLIGQTYVLREDHPICISCFKDKFADKCESCCKPIGPEIKDVNFKGRHWHEQCFKCWGCQKLLSSQQLMPHGEGVYCADCFDKNYALRCNVCNQIFKHGMQKFEYNGKRYHNNCFLCVVCRKPIGSNSFVPREDDFFCTLCYNDNIAQKCRKCDEVLTQGGIIFRDVSYHRECFLCTRCNTMLAHIKFTLKDENAYCIDCHVESFAKICVRCTKPIVGLDESVKYTTFDRRDWHNECFVCKACDKDLVGQRFGISNGEVLCTQCSESLLNQRLF